MENKDMPTAPQPARERFNNTLKARAASIKSVRNDVYTTRAWQLAVYFMLGIGAIALLVASMLTDGTGSIACMISGVVATVFIVFFYTAVRAIAPMSFLQYTEVDGDVRYCFRIMSKHRSVFYDGEHVVEADRNEYKNPSSFELEFLRADFFADMDADLRRAKGEKEIYKGTLDRGDKTVKCKIVFVNNVPVYGVVGGMRIKYFDVNSTKERFVVPYALKQATKSYGFAFPKLSGLYVRDDVNATKQ